MSAATSMTSTGAQTVSPANCLKATINGNSASALPRSLDKTEMASRVGSLGVAQISFSSGGSPIEKTGDSVVLFQTPYGHDAVGPFDGPAAATSFEPICHHVLARPLDQS